MCVCIWGPDDRDLFFIIMWRLFREKEREEREREKCVCVCVMCVCLKARGSYFSSSPGRRHKNTKQKRNSKFDITQSHNNKGH